MSASSCSLGRPRGKRIEIGEHCKIGVDAIGIPACRLPDFLSCLLQHIAPARDQYGVRAYARERQRHAPSNA